MISWGWVANLFSSLLVAVVTAWATVRLSLRSFHSQRWWERKAEIYSRILEHLSQVELYLGHWLDVEFEGRHMPEERQESLGEDRVRAADELAKAAAIGSFVISEEAAEALRDLHREMDNARGDVDLGRVVSQEHDAVVRCIRRVKAEARKELMKG